MLRNSESRYGSVAIWLHWLVAAWFLTVAALPYIYRWVFNEEGPLVTIHKAVGFSILIVFVVRIFWRLTNPVPKLPDSMPRYQVIASHVSHFLLYFLIIAMPLSGYMGNRAGVDFGAFKVTAFKDTGFGLWLVDALGITYAEFEAPFDSFHYEIAGPLILWLLVFVHAGAAFYHHFVEKDDVLTRMLPEKPPR